MKKAIIGKYETFTTTRWKGDYIIEFPDHFECIEDYINHLKENDAEMYNNLHEKLMGLKTLKENTNITDILYFKDVNGDNLRYDEY
jgi:hypothetical protein